MSKLSTGLRLTNADETYEALMAAHRGLDPEASADLNARLVLVLANHIGDLNVLKEAITLAGRPDRAE
jgi:hypothetical protein